MSLDKLTPQDIVNELDKFIVGQNEAKKSVAIALRNRWRRQRVTDPIRNEIMPNNIILIGPTGSGKTEISRRLANLAEAPFIKVEATKYTEVGYVGRDVESIIRDLIEVSIKDVREQETTSIRKKAREKAFERVLDLLLHPISDTAENSSDDPIKEKHLRTRAKIKKQLLSSNLDDRFVELDILVRSVNMQVIAPHGMDDLGMNIQDILSGITPKKRKKKKVTVKDAIDIITDEEIDSLLDMDQIIQKAIDNVENNGIVFIDEIDKVAVSNKKSDGNVSRDGVQRDLLPVIEGTTVKCKHGAVKTDHILFIASGAFHVSKPSDLIPELQGRFPIRVELNALTESDFIQILTEPKNALLKQYQAIVETEGFTITFDNPSIQEIARLAATVNDKNENIGARRLHTILSKLMEDILFKLPHYETKKIKINRKMVQTRLSHLVNDEDLSKFIL